MDKWWQTATAKVLGVGLLALLMTLPLVQVNALVGERQALRAAAVEQVAQGWGGQQVLGGPVLVVPTRVALATAAGQAPAWRSGSETVLADSLRIDAALATAVRGYGIYRVPVYDATVKLAATFRADDIAQFRAASVAAWQGDRAELRLPLGDLRGLRAVDVRVNGRPVRMDSSAQRFGNWPTIVVPLDLDALGKQPITVDIGLTLAGTAAQDFLPLARSTELALRAPWRDPSFTGAALPLAHTINAQGFQAHWRLLDLNRSYGQHWNDADEAVFTALPGSSFGVALYQPVDVYQRNVRAGKYGLLFVALSFVVFFLFEVLRKLRVHPVQYLLVGAALTTFYVVLLALSEQIGFGAAYAVAALAVALIVGGYAAAVLRARRAGALLGGVLALIYAMLYGLIAAEQYALLVGALVLLATVALLMYLTRRIDWYAAATTPAAAIMERP